MSNKTRKFPLRTVLTVTTGRLLTRRRGPHDNGIDDLYDILAHMTNDSVWTHQLGRFGNECRPWLLRWFPELDSPVMRNATAELEDMDALATGLDERRTWTDTWIDSLIAQGICHSQYEIGQIPRDDHEVKDPYDELVIMRGTDEGIILIDVSEGTT